MCVCESGTVLYIRTNVHVHARVYMHALWSYTKPICVYVDIIPITCVYIYTCIYIYIYVYTHSRKHARTLV